jgi:predicted nucleic acid-binding protein
MDAFVLDVSACMPWCCEDETNVASEEMLRWATEGSALHVPSVWSWELLNAVGVIIKRRRISAAKGAEFLELLTTLRFIFDPPPQPADFLRLHRIAGLHGLTAYDVAYLDLSKRRGLPLATRDRELIKASQAEGVEIL